MNLQYQLSNGNWANCGAREYEFLELAVAKSIETTARVGADKLHRFDRHYAAVVDAQTAVAALLAGKILKIGSNWYSDLRAAPAPRPAKTADRRPFLHCASCGQSGHSGAYPFSTLPGSGRCDDCV